MPRQPRKIAASGIYHVVVRGLDKMQLFEDNLDFLSFLRFLDSCESTKFDVLAYVLMGNHVHLLLRVPSGDKGAKVLERSMKSLGIRYVNHYNTRYKRIGSLYQGRFKSQPIEDVDYLMRTLRYIHNNPVKAEICTQMKFYQWSSYQDYFCQRDGLYKVNTQYIQQHHTLAWLEEWHTKAETNPHDFLEVHKSKYRITDTEAKDIMHDLCAGITPTNFISLAPSTRDDAICKLLDAGITQAQLSRLTGISKGIISRVWKNQ